MKAPMQWQENRSNKEYWAWKRMYHNERRMKLNERNVGDYLKPPLRSNTRSCNPLANIVNETKENNPHWHNVQKLNESLNYGPKTRRNSGDDV